MPSTRPRPGVPLTDEELAELHAARRPGSIEHQALADLTGAEPGSLAGTLRAWLTLGRRAMHERMAEYSYAAESAAIDDEDRAVRRALRARLISRASTDDDLSE
ncbi:MAG: hypothetical protein ACRDWI_18755 [Jiangellaceae bacterium]